MIVGPIGGRAPLHFIFVGMMVISEGPKVTDIPKDSIRIGKENSCNLFLSAGRTAVAVDYIFWPVENWMRWSILAIRHIQVWLRILPLPCG